jgi:RNA polymerase sigma factor (sigma-70 family)
MIKAQLNHVIGQLRRLTEPTAADPVPDSQLLQRFTAQHDEAAFARLVQRHGGLVLGVCRSVLHQTQDAEDAFQATFLLLARKAASIRHHDSVASWLYRVGYRMALQAKKRIARERSRELQVSSLKPTIPMDDMTWRELRQVLHEELDRLPEKYRAPLVLCCLEDHPREEAARQLGWTLGTLKGRLQRARDVLRQRLSRRGLVPAATLLTTLFTLETAAAVPSALVQTTARAALASMNGAATAAGISAPVDRLVREGLHTMLVNKLKWATALALTVSLFALGAGLWTHRALADKPPVAPGQQANPKRGAPRPVTPKPDAKAAAAAESRTVSGRVLDAGGQPVAGAAVAVIARDRYANRLSSGYSHLQVLGKTKADGEGRFRLLVAWPARQPGSEVVVLAGSPGHGLAPFPLGLDAKEFRAEIRLPREQVLQGRLVDLQGKPAAGVHVQVISMAGHLPGKSDVYLNFADVPKDRVDQLPWPRAAVTDAKGRFNIRGLGPDWKTSLDAAHTRFASHRLEIKPEDRKGGREFLRSLAPARITEGTVTYADSHKPVPNARLVVRSQKSRNDLNSTLTLEARADAQGRFRINPYGGNFITVTAYPPPGTPYLSLDNSFDWPRADVVKQEVQVALVRGILVKGTVTEKGSGKPVAGAAVGFHQAIGKNRYYRRDLRFETALSGPDGRFELVVQPGPGHLLINGPTPDYLKTEITSRDLYGVPIVPNRRNFYDALVALDLEPQKGPHQLAVSLRRGVTLTGTVIDPDGKPVARAQMACLTYFPTQVYFFGVFTKEVTEGRFVMPGCDPEKPTEIFFCDAKNQLGAVVKLSPKETKGKPATVRLQRSGTAKARIVDAKGKPLANFAVFLDVVISPGVPFVDASFDNPGPAAETTYMTTFDPKRYGNLRSDATGRVSFPTLIPGATYWMIGADPNRGLFNLNKEFKAEAGKALDLGDIVVKPAN